MAREAEGEEGGRQEEIETDKTEREMEHWRQRPIVGVTRLPLGCQLIFPAGYRCGLWCCLVVTLYHHSTYSFGYFCSGLSLHSRNTTLLVWKGIQGICFIRGLFGVYLGKTGEFVWFLVWVSSYGKLSFVCGWQTCCKINLG